MNFRVERISSAKQLRQVARFMARTVSLDPSYISHSEIQLGLSPDGRSWAQDLESKLLDEADSTETNTLVYAAISTDDEILAASRVSVHFDKGPLYAIIEDMAVSPDHRSSGLGSRLADAIEADAMNQGVTWLFLESGKKNVGAHRFFERHGFSEISHVFGKQLSGKKTAHVND